MNIKNLKVVAVLYISTILSCAQVNDEFKSENIMNEESSEKVHKFVKEPHQYGGWYCPDNLNGFPPVNIRSWDKVPVVNGRLATKEETQNGTSLIFVDADKYPNAKPLDLIMPKLASFYNEYSKKEEIVIIIQAINIDDDSIVGFRYLNGGNGSARLSEVTLLTNSEINELPISNFVTLNIKINATQDIIWEILTSKQYSKSLQNTFENAVKLKDDWRDDTNVNYFYFNRNDKKSEYANKLFGNCYIQNDYVQYSEKFLLLENKESKATEFKIVNGPFEEDFETQKEIINNWAKKVKELSEINQSLKLKF